MQLPQALPVPAILPVPQALGRPLPQPRAAGGHIIYTRQLSQQVAAGGVTTRVDTPKLLVMNADGTDVRPFLTGGRFEWFHQPRWSPNYRFLSFTSNYATGFSACFEDIFCLSADGTRLQRVSGNQLYAPSPHGVASVRGLIRDNVSGKKISPEGAAVSVAGRPMSRTQINIAVQGSDGRIYHPLNPVKGKVTYVDPNTGEVIKIDGADAHGNEWQFPFIIPRCAAGLVWIRVWTDRWIGNLKVVTLKPGVMNDVGLIPLSEGNVSSHNGSVSPDGRFAVGVGSIMGYDSKIRGGPTKVPQKRGGADNVCLLRMADGMLGAMFEPTRAAGENAGDPAFSPDGQWIACAWGRFGAENLAVMSLQSFAANRPQMRVVVPGRILLPTMGCRNPTWSPDGRMLAFCRTAMLAGGVVTGNVWVVGANGAGLRQVTNVPANQIACQPTFSPDGRSLAFTVMTNRNPGPLKMEQVILKQVTVDIYRLDLAAGHVRRLTNDGISMEPTWGP